MQRKKIDMFLIFFFKKYIYIYFLIEAFEEKQTLIYKNITSNKKANNTMMKGKIGRAHV